MSQPPAYNTPAQDPSFTPQPAAHPVSTPSANEKAALAGYTNASYTGEHYGGQQVQSTVQSGQQHHIQPQSQTPYQENTDSKTSGPPRNVYHNAVPLASLEKVAAPVDCPLCGVREMTLTTKQSGGTTHGLAALACLCCCLGCIPYMLSDLKDTLHKCGNCSKDLALNHRSGNTEVLVRR